MSRGFRCTVIATYSLKIISYQWCHYCHILSMVPLLSDGFSIIVKLADVITPLILYPALIMTAIVGIQSRWTAENGVVDSCSNYMLTQYSLTDIHKGGLALHHVIIITYRLENKYGIFCRQRIYLHTNLETKKWIYCKIY